MDTNYYVKCSRCSSILPKMLGMPNPSYNWNGWDSGAPGVDTLLNVPSLCDGCPVCEIEAHSAKK